MMRSPRRTFLTLAVAVAAVGMLSVSVQAQWGNLSGQFVLEGDIPVLKPLIEKGAPDAKDPAVCAASAVPDESLVVNPDNKGIQHIVVYLKKAPAMVHPSLKAAPQAPVVIDQIGCRFTPHVSVLRVDQTLQCKNTDACSHNVHTYPFSNTAQNFILAPADLVGKDLKLKLAESRPMKVGCDIHSYMTGWCVVVDHPYAAVTDVDGKFVIENLPVGKHEFVVWQEKAGYVVKKWEIDIKAGDNAQKPYPVAPAVFATKG